MIDIKFQNQHKSLHVSVKCIHVSKYAYIEISKRLSLSFATVSII